MPTSAEFKTDISRSRKEAERKMLGTLIEEIPLPSVERNKAKLRELERKSRSKNQFQAKRKTLLETYISQNEK